jgi:hypothetical protein
MNSLLWRQVHDLSSGVQAVGSICHAIDDLATTLDKLEDPHNWIVGRDARGVQVMQMPRSEDHTRYLEQVVDAMWERAKTTDQWFAVWNDMESHDPVKDEDETG